MRNLATKICNVVATLDYSRPRCNLNLYNFSMTIYKAGGGSVCHVVAIGRHGVDPANKEGFKPTNLSRSETMGVLFVYILW
jgi:hypothetical protein